MNPTGLLFLTTGLAVLAGVCAFLIDYEEETHRFPRPQARRRALRAGVVAASFFAVLGAALDLLLLH